MMNILLISYGNVDYDGRLRSLITIFEAIGKVYSFTRGKQSENNRNIICNLPYIQFIKKSVEFSRKIEKIDVLVLDNRKATIPGFFIQKIKHPTFLIQDCRELYLLNEVKHFSGKVGCVFEKMMTQKADIVICANKDRAEIMKKQYGLSKMPLTYENLRELQYSSKQEYENARIKFTSLINEDEIRLLSSSGCSIKRTNDILVQNLKYVNKKCRLFLVGSYNEREAELIRKIAESDKVNTVNILGQLNQTELKYLISHSHIGIVNYGQYDTNNRLCASGKLYEFLYEGVPVVTTTNPPLKRICQEMGIGVSDNKYADGINTILANYNSFKENVATFISHNSIKSNNEKLIIEICQILKNSSKI